MKIIRYRKLTLGKIKVLKLKVMIKLNIWGLVDDDTAHVKERMEKPNCITTKLHLVPCSSYKCHQCALRRVHTLYLPVIGKSANNSVCLHTNSLCRCLSQSFSLIKSIISYTIVSSYFYLPSVSNIRSGILLILK